MLKIRHRQRYALGTLASLAGFPETTLTGGPTLECHENREVAIDGCTGILEYNDRVIRLSAKEMTLKFSGESLSIGAMEKRGLVICGQIRSIEFL